MKALGVFFGILIGLFFGIVFSGLNREIIIDFYQREFYSLLFTVSALLIIVTLIYIFQGKIFEFVFGISVENTQDFVERAASTLAVFAERDSNAIRKEAKETVLTGVALYSAWSFRVWAFQTAIAIMVVLAGAFGTIVLIQQNQLIEEQAGLIKIQTDRVGDQNNLLEVQNKLLEKQNQSVFLQAALQESSRRSVLAPTVAQLISDIYEISDEQVRTDENIDDPENDTEYGLVKIPENIYSRIQGILPTLQPYVVLEFQDSALNLTRPMDEAANVLRLSPERGQILQALLRSRVDLSGYSGFDISELDFSYADMRNFSFDGSQDGGFDPSCSSESPQPFYSLEYLNLANADFSGAKLSRVHINVDSESRWYGARIYDSFVALRGGAKKQPQFVDTYFGNTALRISSEAEANLSGVIFSTDSSGCIFLEEGVEQIGETFANNLSGLRVRVSNRDMIDSSKSLKAFIFNDYIVDEQGIQYENYVVEGIDVQEIFNEYYEITIK